MVELDSTVQEDGHPWRRLDRGGHPGMPVCQQVDGPTPSRSYNARREEQVVEGFPAQMVWQEDWHRACVGESERRAHAMGCNVTLLDLVHAVSRYLRTDAEIVAHVTALVNSGRFRLSGNFKGARFDDGRRTGSRSQAGRRVRT